MKVTSIRYLDAKFHHPSLGASPPNRGKTVFACLQNSRKMENRNFVNKFRHRYSMLWQAEYCCSCERTSKRFDELLLSAATGNLRHSLKINLYGLSVSKGDPSMMIMITITIRKFL